MDGWSEGGDEQRSIARREERKIGFLIVVFEKPGLGRKETLELMNSVEKMAYGKVFHTSLNGTKYTTI